MKSTKALNCSPLSITLVSTKRTIIVLINDCCTEIICSYFFSQGKGFFIVINCLLQDFPSCFVWVGSNSTQGLYFGGLNFFFFLFSYKNSSWQINHNFILFFIFLALVKCSPTLSMELFYMGLRHTSATFASAFFNIIPATTFLIAILLRYFLPFDYWWAHYVN